MKLYKLKIDEKKPQTPPEPPPHKEDFSHIEGDVEDFIFSFSDNKKHSEK